LRIARSEERTGIFLDFYAIITKILSQVNCTVWPGPEGVAGAWKAGILMEQEGGQKLGPWPLHSTATIEDQGVHMKPVRGFTLPAFCCVTLATLVVLGGCAKPHEESTHAHEESVHEEEHGHEGGHAHTAPHQGTLISLGDHFAHVELLIDPKEGSATVYVLDGEAEKPVRITQKEILIQISGIGPNVDPQTQGELLLHAVTNPLTGETEGDTSQFEGTSDLLKMGDHFKGVIQEIAVKGQEIKAVEFAHPGGNE
jgi:hypothetical protein